MKIGLKRTLLPFLGLSLLLLSFSNFVVAEEPIVLRYAHMNPPTSVAGQQATMLAKLVEEKTKGRVKIQVYPSSQLGGLQEQAEMVSVGTVAIHHNTMAGIGSLYGDFAALDTPYLYKDVAHLMRVTNPWTSPLMKTLNQKLIQTRNVRVFYTFFFGTRQLTCDRPIYSPNDLKGVKIRAIPFPIYTATVQAMGAVAVPLDFAEVPTALATGAINGQEHPPDTILTAKL
ncbi:MAG: TRAP transporter substrate-binding protein [Firmicutes bacterium]|nr:TRAP transporter substrate-binding protein [Bacillota bacterium]